MPDWTEVREALAEWDARQRADEAERAEEGQRADEGQADPFVREGAHLLLEALEEFSRGLDGKPKPKPKPEPEPGATDSPDGKAG